MAFLLPFALFEKRKQQIQRIEFFIKFINFIDNYFFAFILYFKRDKKLCLNLLTLKRIIF